MLPITISKMPMAAHSADTTYKTQTGFCPRASTGFHVVGTMPDMESFCLFNKVF